MPHIKTNDIQTFYLDYPAENGGDRPPIIFLHGFTLDHRMWGAEALSFKKKYRLILPDARGHGQSDIPKTNYSRDHRVQDLAALIDGLKLERVHLVGLSMGGSTAIGYALKRQDRLASLTLVSSGAAGYGAGKKLDRLDRMAREASVDEAKETWMEWSLAWYNTPARAPIAEKMRRMMEEHTGAVWADHMRGKYPRTYDLDHVHTIETPTLIIAGSLDRIFVPLAQKLAEKMPNAKLVQFENVGHMVNMEAPERFTRELELFLEKNK